jgi:tetratricopeptide (TPR) repeat protein/tRNA A-37 threonylcarbamoyl transferase component Bud32
MRPAPEPLVVGDYTLGERIGGGRSARVYRARGRDGEVAIKLLAPDAELDDPAVVARFRHEVQALGAVRHPNVVALLDHGVDAELGPYLVMPLVEGRSLREHIAAGPVAPAVAALAMRELSAGLAALHDAALVHRDLKPENIVIDDAGRPIILDLGLAWSAHQTRHTAEGAVAGSVPYMAPEQIEGGAPSPATDVWALAVITWEWITGARPFGRSRQSEEVAAILAGRLEPLATRDRRVDAAFGALLDRCLTRDARPAGGAALCEALANLVTGDAAEALRDPRAASACESERAARALVAEARRLIARGKAFAAADRIERAAAHRPDDAEILALADEVGRAPARRSRARVGAATAVVAIVAIAAAAVALAPGRGGDRAGREAPPSEPAAMTAADFPAQVEADGEGLALLEVPRHEPLFDTSDLEHGPIAYTMRHTRAIEDSNDPAEHHVYARALLSTTRRAEGVAFLERSLARFPDDAGLWLLRGQLALRTGDPDGAEEALTRALALDPTLAAALRDRGELHRLRGRLRAAFEDLSAARQHAPDDAAVLTNLAQLAAAIGRDDQARTLALRATELAPTHTVPWLVLAAVSPDEEAIGYLESALRNDPLSQPALRAMCLRGARLDRPRALDDCLRAGGYREDAEVALAQSSLWQRRGNLQRARVVLLGATFSIDDDVRLWAKLAELEELLGDRYSLAKSRARACALGHQPSCASAADSPVSN